MHERIVPRRLIGGFSELLRANPRRQPDAEGTQQQVHLVAERFTLTNWSRAPRSVLRRWLSIDFTWTGENQPVRGISAKAKASALSLLIRRLLMASAARVHAYHWIAHAGRRAEAMRRERAAFQPDLGELTVKPLQSRRKHLKGACQPCPATQSCRPRLQRTSSPACPQRPILQTWSSLLSIRHSRITSESFIPSAEEQQPHVRDV
jgi:hypothetical protein